MQTDNINWELIFEGCLKGNANSQRILYEQFYGFGMNIALRYSSNFHLAEELLNDAFLKVFKNLDRYDREYDFRGWFKKIIANTAIDLFRKEKKRRMFNFSMDLAIKNTLTEELDWDFEHTQDVLPEVQALPPAYRMVFNLYVMEEYKHHEIAEMLDISVGTSKSNLSRAKNILRKTLKKKDNKGKNRVNG